MSSLPAVQALRPDIQGLRAVSILAVVLAHSQLPGFSGGFIGVDVFFVISGFLISRLLLSEAVATGHIDVKRFWIKRARRLLPNACLTLATTAILATFVFPGYDLHTLAKEITSAALNYSNFHFADKSADYFHFDGSPSPVMHFWSLSVEEQFYLLWPLTLIVLARKFPHKIWKAAAIVLVLVWIGSFAISLVLTAIDQPVAYFHTAARCWQLATGALLVIFWDGIAKIDIGLRRLMAGLGAAAVAFSIAVFDASTLYPGYWALLPTLGTAAIIAGAQAGERGGWLERLLSLPVLQWIGARSYSWYLWHWPLIVLPQATFPDTPYVALISLPLSLLIASLVYWGLEDPIRRNRMWVALPLPFMMGAGAALIGVIGIAFGAILLPSLADEATAARMAVLDASSQDRPRVFYDRCHLRKKDIKQPECLYGDVTGRRRVVIFGDSHAAQWFDALDAAAKQTGWQMNSWTKGACPSVDVALSWRPRGSRYSACDHWRDAVMADLTGRARPDLVVISNRKEYTGRIFDPISGNFFSHSVAEEAWRNGFRRILDRLTQAGIKVVVIGDIPRAHKYFATCLAQGRVCDRTRTEAIGSQPDIEVAKEFNGKVTLVDFTDEMCDEVKCPTTKNGMIIYRDDYHLTAKYAATFAPQLSQLLSSFAD